MTLNMLKSHKRSLVVFSGGFDSTSLLITTLAANEMDSQRVLALSFNYGQRHVTELAAAAAICKQLKITHKVIEMADWDIYNPRTCALMYGSDVLITKGKRYEEIVGAGRDEMGAVNTSVPMRNVLFAVVAAIKAYEYGCQNVSLAVHKGDNDAFSYPDCSFDTLAPLSNAIGNASMEHVQLLAPFIGLQKWQIIKEVRNYGIAVFNMWLDVIGQSWSCYDGKDLHCGECATCLERQDAFKQAGVADPTQYKSMCADKGK